MKALFKKYYIYISYIFSSGISFILDLTLFSLFLWLIDDIIISSYLARAISSFINYLLNKYKVFKYEKNGKDNTFIAYFSLVIINITLSAILVDTISNFIPIYATFIKVVVDLL
ncbi:MAG TPA: GtrA family protein, partial [Candidatus Onthocola stercoravium]|nr:GtrA family protein [Candidatus Onthocola stercoravium]